MIVMGYTVSIHFGVCTDFFHLTGVYKLPRNTAEELIQSQQQDHNVAYNRVLIIFVSKINTNDKLKYIAWLVAILVCSSRISNENIY